MYAPVLARFTALDPLPPDGEPVMLGASRYGYVANNPVNRTDPSGLKPEEKPKNVDCNVRICINPISGDLGKIGGHLYIVLERTINGKSVEWYYRGGPGYQNSKGDCDLKCKKYGQLITHDGEYKPGTVDWPEDKERCKKVTISASDCEKVHGCLAGVLDAIDKCCIEYTPIPLGFGLDGKCNSNCVVTWMIKQCFAPPKGDPIGFVPLPADRLPVGFAAFVPDCIKNPKK